MRDQRFNLKDWLTILDRDIKYELIYLKGYIVTYLISLGFIF
jgi:hypothetical protein